MIINLTAKSGSKQPIHNYDIEVDSFTPIPIEQFIF